MKKTVSVILSFVLMCTCVFCGCGKNGKGGSVSAGSATVYFGNSMVEGIKTSEPKDLKTSGTSVIKNISIDVGDFKTEYTCRTLKGKGSQMSFTLSGITSGVDIMLDIEEIHSRNDQRFSYEVSVNDTAVYYRTYEPCSDGANHCFFDIPASLVTKDSLTVKIVSTDSQEIRFHRVFAISDPDNTAAEQGISQKMQVMLMLNEVPSNLDLNYLSNLVNKYACNDMYEIGLCWEIQYMQWGKTKTESYLDNVISASLATGAPLYLGINSWWSGTPSGSDGIGGKWSDPGYQQVTYNSAQNTYLLSTPNSWGNTPWLTMNNDTYNAARAERIEETMQYLQRRTAELATSKVTLPAIHVYTENEPIYWPINWYYKDNDKYDLGIGDFSPYVIEDAKADGVTLNPEDGLSDEEIMWMYKNYNTYMSEVGNAIAKGASYNYITVKDGEIIYPEDQMIDNAYSHSGIQPAYPNWDTNQRLYENHILSSIHFGGEWNKELSSYSNVSKSTASEFGDDTRSLDYILSYGSYADINCERGGIAGDNMPVLSQCYAYGLEGVVIYNVNTDSDYSAVKSESGKTDDLMNTAHYPGATLVTNDFSKESDYSLNKYLTKISGFRYDGTALVLNSQSGGKLIYKVSDKTVLENGISLSVNTSFSSQNATAEISYATDGKNFKSLEQYTVDGNIYATLNKEQYGSTSTVYVAFDVKSQNTDIASMSEICISSASISEAEPRSGRTDGTQYTRQQLRTRCQIIEKRADTERMLEKYLKKTNGKTDEKYFAACKLYADGKYGDAFKALSKAISTVLPADFLVSGYGQLDNYPIYVETDGKKVSVHLTEASDTGATFSLTCSEKTTVKVSFMAKSGGYELIENEDGSYTVKKGGKTKVSDGKATFEIEYRPQVLPKSFEGSVKTAGGNSITFTSQDKNMADKYADSVQAAVSDDAVIYRGKDGTPKESLKACSLSDIRNGDYIQAKTNEDGKVTEIYAFYGELTGTVKAVKELSLKNDASNPTVTVSAGGKEYTFEIGGDCKLEFSGATGENIKLATVGKIGLKVGASVTVKYSPYKINDRVRALAIS